MSELGWDTESVNQLSKALDGVFGTSSNYANPSIYYDYGSVDKRDTQKIKSVMEVWHRSCGESDSDFPETYYQCTVDRDYEECRHHRVSFRFSDPNMGINFMEHCGELLKAIVEGRYRDMDDKRFKEILENRALASSHRKEEPTFEPFDPKRYMQSGEMARAEE